MRLLGANPESGFVDFMYAITYPLLAPFFGIFGTPQVADKAFEGSTLVAMAVYAVIGYGIVKIIRIATVTHEKEVEQNISSDRAR